jgi:Protein of unknown function (DUF3592)
MMSLWTTLQLVLVIAAAVFAGAAMSRVVHGAVTLRRSAYLRESGCVTTGAIVDTKVRTHNFKPVVAFRTRDGEEVTTVAPKTVSRAFVADAVVPIRYDPADPAYVEITDGPGAGSDGLAHITTGGVAVLATVVAVVLTIATLH